MVAQSRPPGASDRALLAVDIGGTKLEVGLVGEAAEVVWSHRCSTPDTDADGLYGTLQRLVVMGLEAAEQMGITLLACGVGCGGPMSPGGETVSPLNIPAWRQFPLRPRLAADTGLAITVDNDAKSLALAEQWAGRAQGVPNFMAMVVSTGVGGGLVVDGRLLDGRLGNAGHIGHVIVDPDGAPCACGARGCLEAQISGPSIARRIGDDPAQASEHERSRAGRLLGRAVASVASLLDLDLVVVGGSVALGYGEPFFAAARAECAARAQIEFASRVRIEPVGLGSEGPLIGAAALARRALLESGHWHRTGEVGCGSEEVTR